MTVKGTRKTWPDETPEEVVARVRAQHGDVVADLVLKEFATPKPPRRNPPKMRVGNKERTRAAIPQPKRRMTAAEAAEKWRDVFDEQTHHKKGRRGFNRSGLPSSGAPKAKP